jgi:tyrosyl-tRNA synthetase
MKSYREQVTPFFDFEHAEFRYNSEWLAPLTSAVQLADEARRISEWIAE